MTLSIHFPNHAIHFFRRPRAQRHHQPGGLPRLRRPPLPPHLQEVQPVPQRRRGRGRGGAQTQGEAERGHVQGHRHLLRLGLLPSIRQIVRGDNAIALYSHNENNRGYDFL